MRVSYNGNTSAFQADARGSIPLTRSSASPLRGFAGVALNYNMIYVYILQSEIENKIYIGITDDVQRRLKEHNAGDSKYTKSFRPWWLVNVIGFSDYTKASTFEKYLKNGSGFAFMKKHLLPPQ